MNLNQSEQQILQKNLAQFLVKEVFATISKEDLLEIRGPNVWFNKGRQLTPEEINSLKAEAKLFKEGKLWKLISETLLYHAQKSGLEKARTENDLISAKMLIYLTDIIKTVVSEIVK